MTMNNEARLDLSDCLCVCDNSGPGVERLGHPTIPASLPKEPPDFAPAAAPFYVPTSSAHGLQFLHIVANAFFFFLFLLQPS